MRVGNVLYLDHQASSPLDPRVLEVMMPFLTQQFGNPHSSEHVLGWRAAEAINNAKVAVSGLVGAEADEIFFTSGATESNNLALLGLSNHDQVKSKRAQMLVSAIEHKSVLAAAEEVRRVNGCNIDYIPVCREGFIDLDVLKDKLSEGVFAVSIMAVNNEVGSVQNFELIGKMCKEHGTIFHCDAAQFFEGLDIDVYRDNIDLLSLSSHKMYGPMGVGALYIARHLQKDIAPLLHGGGQQSNLRSGTLPVPLCVGMGAAADLMMQGKDLGTEICEMRNRLVKGIGNLYPGMVLNGPSYSRRHPGNANVCFEGLSGHDLVSFLQPHVAASTGSACTSGVPEPSYVLRRLGLTDEEASASVRFSLGRFTTAEDVDSALHFIDAAINKACTVG